MSLPHDRAAAWLNATYRGLVELSAPRPVHESYTAWVFSCRTLAQPGYPATPMLAASVVVPKDGSSPFHPSTSNPLADLEPADPQEAVGRVAHQARRINARGCLVAVHSAIERAPSVPLPWQPSDEAPGWWERLTRRYFPAFRQVAVSDWDSVIRAVAEPGPHTRGVVWVRRELGGAEATGNLLYAHNNNGQVVLVDGVTSSLARLDTDIVRELVLLRSSPEAHTPPWQTWEREAHDFESAAAKARFWLEDAYHGQVVLDAPTPQDETRRGWVFSCNTVRFLRDGQWQDALLDATLVVPKDATAPFGLPNSDPWAWLARWDAGENPGAADFPVPPAPGRASWFQPTLSELGSVISVSEHQDWPGAFEALSALPDEARALVWVRRTDGRSREAVGWLVTARKLAGGVMLIDGATGAPAAPDPTGVHRLHVIRYR
ncbi:YrhB domain-containing protein [Streptomyces sp. NPDC088254]|uniref:YrhB domain-containing protein n=1 Tax=Streptomyces sp. NPDC088254 TaxID=3365847 RepID=UPI00381ABAD6